MVNRNEVDSEIRPTRSCASCLSGSGTMAKIQRCWGCCSHFLSGPSTGEAFCPARQSTPGINGLTRRHRPRKTQKKSNL